MKVEGIDAVFLDAAGTLFEVRGSVGEIYSRVARRLGVKASAADLQEAFAAAFRGRPPMAFGGLEAEDLADAERQWWFSLVQEVLEGRMPAPLIPRYFAQVFEEFRSGSSWCLYPDTRASLERLGRKGRRLAVVSNFDSRLDDILRALGIAGFFECVIISSRCTAAKPDPRIFSLALEQMETRGERTLHAGDSLEEDFYGARQAGVHAVLVDRAGRHPAWTAGRRVESLSELCDALAV